MSEPKKTLLERFDAWLVKHGFKTQGDKKEIIMSQEHLDKMETLDADLETANGKITELETQITAQKKKETELTSQLNTANAEIATLTARVAELQKPAKESKDPVSGKKSEGDDTDAEEEFLTETDLEARKMHAESKK